MGTVTPRKLREATGEALRETMNATEVEQFCTEIGLAPPNPPDDIASLSKRAYVVRRLTGKAHPELVRIAAQVLDECEGGPAAAELAEVVASAGGGGVAGELKNLIFAADGPKPEFVFSDALNNDLKAIKYAENCLIYDRPLGADALTWRQLGSWWAERQGMVDAPPREVFLDLCQRLEQSLDNDAERRIMRVYTDRSLRLGPTTPALIPQVYLHYDPYHQARYGSAKAPLGRQRMDFLLLLPNRIRVVIECDGIQHYADDQVLDNGRQYANTRRYAEMMAEDRALRLRGYEVYRFGGFEMLGPGVEERLDAFFDALDRRYAPAPLPG